MSANLENSAVATGLEKVCFHSNPEERHVKECSNYCTIALISHPSTNQARPCLASKIRRALISHASKVMLKILQARLQQYVNWELPDVQVGFRKGRGTRDQIANIHRITEKAREFRKTSTSALLTMPKPLTVWIITNCGKFLKRWKYQTTLPAS